MHHPTDRITHTTTFVTPVVEHWLEREIAQWVHHEGSIRRPIIAGFIFGLFSRSHPITHNFDNKRHGVCCPVHIKDSLLITNGKTIM